MIMYTFITLKWQTNGKKGKNNIRDIPDAKWKSLDDVVNNNTNNVRDSISQYMVDYFPNCQCMEVNTIDGTVKASFILRRPKGIIEYYAIQ